MYLNDLKLNIDGNYLIIVSFINFLMTQSSIGRV